MSAPTDDPRFPHLRVCREHRGLYDPAPHPETGEQQRCHGRLDQPKWEHFDFNKWVHLCEACQQETQWSGSRWSLYFCDTCLPLVKGEPSIPIGGHTLMNGVVLPANYDAARRRIREMYSAIDALSAWSDRRLHALLGDSDADPELAAVMAAARRRGNQKEAVRELAEFWRR